MKSLSNSLVVFAMLSICTFAFGQTGTDSLQLENFKKLVVSPRINVVLRKGTQPFIKLEYSKVSPDQVNVHVSNGTLKIYLDHARWTERQVYVKENGYDHSVPLYQGASVTAYITYTSLEDVEIRGEQRVTFDNLFEGDELKIKAYGETDIFFPSMKVNYMDVILYGSNHFVVEKGSATNQKYRLLGSNVVDAGKLTGKEIATTIYGDSKLRINASSEFSITAIGEPLVEWSGTAHLHRGLIVGEPTILSIKP